jgi:MFS family permease
MAESMTPRYGTIGRALAHRNYRLFFAGQSVSLIGSWITRVAMSWLVYRLTGSAWTLGIVGFAGQFPTFLLAPVAGAWVDRWNRHRLLVGSLFAGTVATWIGAPRTILIGGAVCALAALVFWRALPQIRREARPVYVRLGILPTPTEQNV